MDLIPVLIVIVVIVVIYLLFRNQRKCTDAANIAKQRAQDLTYTRGTEGYAQVDGSIDGLRVDALECHPDCCGFDTEPYDGLTPTQLKQRIMRNVTSESCTPRSNYTCANGPNGVGCPCFTPRAYTNLVNRSQRSV